MPSGTHLAILLRKIACWWTPPIPRNSSVPELAARFFETLMAGQWPAKLPLNLMPDIGFWAFVMDKMPDSRFL